MTAFAQTVKVENGLAFSKLNHTLGKCLVTYSPFIGVDYCMHKNWNLSNEIGILNKGGIISNGADENGVLQNDIDINLYYLHLNALFCYKLSIHKTTFYGSIGPKADILLSKKLPFGYFSDYSFNKINYGLKPSVGFSESLNQKLSVGLKLSYLIDFNKAANSSTATLKSSTYLLTSSITYSL
jgi:hypothetical protein